MNHPAAQVRNVYFRYEALEYQVIFVIAGVMIIQCLYLELEVRISSSLGMVQCSRSKTGYLVCKRCPTLITVCA